MSSVGIGIEARPRQLHGACLGLNALLVAERRKRVGLSKGQSLFRALMRSGVQVEEALSDRQDFEIALLATRHASTAYDACYPELARPRRLLLASLDRRLLSAAENEKVATIDDAR